MESTPSQQESWKYTAKWHNGKSSLTGEFIGPPDEFDLNNRDKHGLHLYDDVVRMLGYEPTDWGLIWERLDNE